MAIPFGFIKTNYYQMKREKDESTKEKMV